MKSVTGVLLALISAVLVTSCRKDSIFSNGEVVERTLDYRNHYFKCVEMCDDVDVKLLHCDESHPYGTIVVRAGSRLIDSILADTTKPDTLIINNRNRLKWLRPYDAITEMTIYYDSLSTIVFNSNGRLITDDLCGICIPIEMDTTMIIENVITQDSTVYDTISPIMTMPALRIDVLGGSGDIEVNVNCYQFVFQYEAGTSMVNLSGNASITYAYTSENAHGPVNCKALNTNIFYATSYGTNNMIVKAFHSVDAKNYNNGTVYFVEYLGAKKTYVYDSVTHMSLLCYIDVLCPEELYYNGQMLQPQEYANDLPGLRKIVE